MASTSSSGCSGSGGSMAGSGGLTVGSGGSRVGSGCWTASVTSTKASSTGAAPSASVHSKWRNASSEGNTIQACIAGSGLRVTALLRPLVVQVQHDYLRLLILVTGSPENLIAPTFQS